jgi:hypothetical protein
MVSDWLPLVSSCVKGIYTSPEEVRDVVFGPTTAAEQALAADGAIACFSSSLFHSARMLIARRS